MPGRIIAELQHVDVILGTRVLFHDLSLTLRTGTVTVISGPPGSGKSTLLDLLWGGVQPVSGTIVGNDVQFSGMPPRRWTAWRRQIGILTDDFPLQDEWSIIDNVAVALQTAGDIPPGRHIEQTTRALHRWGLVTDNHRAVRELSGEERSRVKLARAFVRRPCVAILDDPLAGIADDRAAAFYQQIKNESISGTAVVVASSSTSPWIPWVDHMFEISDAGLKQLDDPVDSALVRISTQAAK